jgi:hypothetical protein
MNPEYSPPVPQTQHVRVDRRFRVFEVPKDQYTKRTKCKLIEDTDGDKTTKIVHEEYMPPGRQFDVVVNRSGATIRCLENEMRRYGFDQSPNLLDVDTGALIPTDEDMVKVSLDSVEK